MGGASLQISLARLPEPGGVWDQPAWLMDALDLLTGLMMRREDDGC